MTPQQVVSLHSPLSFSYLLCGSVGQWLRDRMWNRSANNLRKKKIKINSVSNAALKWKWGSMGLCIWLMYKNGFITGLLKLWLNVQYSLYDGSPPLHFPPHLQDAHTSEPPCQPSHRVAWMCAAVNWSVLRSADAGHHQGRATHLSGEWKLLLAQVYLSPKGFDSLGAEDTRRENWKKLKIAAS